ncbi:UNKNOWN [Stylonychia lemnae]|uniref:Uncharacterized protein n=1 Tax=Stylonychia lemnae TaxID=5949 RepID=A0A078ABT7_STYLE|nr:UNKNOWN [Stylonychia lemnae]|eukprot:CDW78243.1 UNKNOWN [Stylonychia lemnae]
MDSNNQTQINKNFDYKSALKTPRESVKVELNFSGNVKEELARYKNVNFATFHNTSIQNKFSTRFSSIANEDPLNIQPSQNINNELPEIHSPTIKSTKNHVKKQYSINPQRDQRLGVKNLLQSQLNQSRMRSLLGETQQVVLDYPRQIRLSSKNDTISQIRKSLRKNRIFHTQYDASLENLKSRMLLKGIYEPNKVDQPFDKEAQVIDHIKLTGNYKKEKLKICELYDEGDQQQINISTKYNRNKRNPQESQDYQERQYFNRLIKENAFRNKEVIHKKDEDGHVVNDLEPIKLNLEQQRKIIELVNKKNQMLDKTMHMSFESKIKKLEKLLEDGYTIEMTEETKIAKKSPSKSFIVKEKMFLTSRDRQSEKSNNSSVSKYISTEPNSKENKTSQNWRKKVNANKDNILDKINQSLKFKVNETYEKQVQIDKIKEFTNAFNQIKKQKQQPKNKKLIISHDESNFEPLTSFNITEKQSYRDQLKEKLSVEQNAIQDNIKQFLDKTYNVKKDVKHLSEKQIRRERIHKSFDITLPSSTYNQNRDQQQNMLSRPTMQQQGDMFSDNFALNESRNSTSPRLNHDSLMQQISMLVYDQPTEKPKKVDIKKQQQNDIRSIIDNCYQTEEHENFKAIKEYFNNDHILVEQQQDRLLRAIDTYQESFLAVIKQSKNEKSLYCNDIMMEQLKEDGENFENFLRPEYMDQIKKEKMNNLRSVLFGKKTKIWKPSKYEIPRSIRNVFLGNGAADP